MSTPTRVPLDVVAAVGLGGALGAAARYGLALAWPTAPGHVPWATLVTNVVGCALLGALMRVIATRLAPHRLLRPFLGTGVLGGFTTFSTYVVESRALAGGGHPVLAVGYVLGTLAAALVAVVVGDRVAGWFL